MEVDAASQLGGSGGIVARVGWRIQETCPGEPREDLWWLGTGYLQGHNSGVDEEKMRRGSTEERRKKAERKRRRLGEGRRHGIHEERKRKTYK